MMAGFEFRELPLKGSYSISCFYAGDSRGGLAKSFEKEIYRNAGIEFALSETFASVSAKNVIRGLHFQYRDPQAKLVCVVKGKVWDVIVDLRKGSRTYGKWVAEELSSTNHKALYVPRGFAHGFASLEDGTVMLYQCDGAYDRESDTGIRFDDPHIGIDWPIGQEMAIHSPRDMELMGFEEFDGHIDFITSAGKSRVRGGIP